MEGKVRGDVPELKRKLQDTSQMCECLLTQLDHSYNQSILEHPVGSTVNAMQNLSLHCNEETTKFQQENNQLREHNSKLENQLKEALRINCCWQEHNEQRDNDINTLTRRLKDAEIRTGKKEVVVQHVDQQNQHDFILQQWKLKSEMGQKHLQEVEAVCMNIKMEKQDLKMKLLEKEELVKVLQQQIKIQSQVMREGLPEDKEKIFLLQQQVEAVSVAMKAENRELKVRLLEQEEFARILQQQLDQQAKAIAEKTEDKEKISMLEQQVKLYEQDFQQERKDRERAHSKIETLEQQLMLTRKELNYNLHEPQGRYTFPEHVPEYDRYSGSHIYPDLGRETVALGGLIQSDGAEDNEERILQVDRYSEPGTADVGMECPKCLRSYPIEKHSELLLHIDKCLGAT